MDAVELAKRAYVQMLRIPPWQAERASFDYQSVLAELRDFIAESESRDPEAVQDWFESK